MKQYKTSLVIGKFYPFHRGHEYLIQTAINNSDKVTVIICQTNRYKIPIKTRARWIKNTFPDVIVKIFHHDPSLDSNSTDLSQTWAELTIKFLGFVPDCIFSSEKYGQPYAEFMGSHHELVDLRRVHIPISATKIRNNLDQNWDYLTPEAKGYLARRIVILGAESTGTTTLARDLADHFNTPWVPEYGRTYYEGKMAGKDRDNWQTAEFIHIAKVQNQMEDALAKQANKILICDTNSFATELWHERYLGTMSKEVNKIGTKAKADLYVVTNTDIPFVQDGTRDGEHIRQNMHNRFLEELEKRHHKYFVVSGSREQRLKVSIEAISKLFQR